MIEIRAVHGMMHRAHPPTSHLAMLMPGRDAEIVLRFIGLPPGPATRGRASMVQVTMAIETGRRRLRECTRRRDAEWIERALNALARLVDGGIEGGATGVVWS